MNQNVKLRVRNLFLIPIIINIALIILALTNTTNKKITKTKETVKKVKGNYELNQIYHSRDTNVQHEDN